MPDVWTSRWPDFDGVVWYRVTWHRPSTASGDALLINYINMAGAVYLNGSPLGRDEHLTEPLSRSWNTPQYWLLAAPLLRDGDNTVAVRVSGLAAYQPGLGEVLVGDPAVIRPRYLNERWVRLDTPRYNLAITATLGCFFVVLWLIRRKESVYGWFGLQALTWWAYVYNEVATSPWPFRSTDAWEALSSILFVVCGTCFAMFTIRICERRLPRIEAGLWLLAAGQVAAMLTAPRAQIAEVRALIALIPCLVFFASCLAFIGFALRARRIELMVLCVCMAAFVASGVHDLLVFLQVLGSNVYYTPLTSQLEMACMALVLAWRFADSLRRVESFSADLSAKVAEAREELRVTLHRQHELEVTNARLSERLSLAHDLHDGLGGTLVSNIAALEHAPPHDMSTGRFLGILRELRDDLRIIIDTASVHQSGSGSLADLVAPLRHRLTRSFETQGIECRWRLPDDLAGLHLPSAVCIDVMRLLQESLTNVLRHSNASRVTVDLHDDGPQLRLEVGDNGCGFDANAMAARQGTGMRSMQGRVRRLGGTLQIESGNGGTVVRIGIPRSAPQAALAVGRG